MLNEKEFLQIKETFIKEVIERLRNFAKFEAKTLFREHYFQPETSLTTLSVNLSSEIIKITDIIADLIEHGQLSKTGFYQKLMMEFLPESLLEKVGRDLFSKLPSSYVVRAMASVLASRIIYHEGIAYLSHLNQDQIMTHIIQYFRQEEKTGSLIRQIEKSDIKDKNQIVELLRLGATGTALRWKN